MERFDQMSLDLGWFLWVLSCFLSHRTNDSCKCSLEGCGFQLQLLLCVEVAEVLCFLGADQCPVVPWV